MEEKTKEQLLAKIAELEAQIRSLNNSILDKKDEYGLRWIDVPEAFETETENKIPILEEIKDLAIKNDDGKPTHILIEGDNYHALQCLNYTHKGKIDVIYIDPPYNTGKEFIYKDKRVLDKFPNGQTIDSNHPLRHSAWLSFMNKRLQLAKNLLSEKGVIFISIDDNEQANLKLLCDEIFGEGNFISNIIWQKKFSPQNDAKFFSDNHDFILCYAKNAFCWKPNLMTRDDVANSRYKNPDNDPRGPWTSSDLAVRTYNPDYDFPITTPTGKVVYPAKGRCWMTNKDKIQQLIDDGRIWFGLKGDNMPRYKTFLSEVKQGIVPLTIWLHSEVGHNQAGRQELKNILPQGNFISPKPTLLLKKIFQLSSSPTSTVLDFFAGSGTTLHATMKLNEQDGGKRQCILVNVNENNICRDVTYERNRRVMQGYENAKGEKIAGLGNSLKYYKTAFVGKNPAASATDEDKVSLAHKAGHLIAIAENTLEEISATACYQIFSDGEKFTAIYFSGDLSLFPKFAEKIESLRDKSRLTTVATYIYSIGTVENFENEFQKLTRISLHAIPQPIIEIYKQLNL